MGFGLSDHLARAAGQRPGNGLRFGQAKACILVFLYGSPAQHETFDPKPDAIAEVRGEIGSIPSALPGVRVANCCRVPHRSWIS